jgi:hypothetical protein
MIHNKNSVEVHFEPVARKEEWETPDITSTAISDLTQGGPTRGMETGGDIGPS